MTIIFWFKRDLRVYDNRALYAASKLGEVLPIFIIDTDILDRFEAYDLRLGFIITALQKLSEEIPLKVYVGKTLEIFDYLIEKYKPKAIVTAEAFTWSGEERLKKVETLAINKKVRLVKIFDNFLADFRKIKNFWSFSSFYKKWKEKLDLEIIGKFNVKFLNPKEEPTWQEAAKKLKYEINKFNAYDAEKFLKYDFSKYRKLRKFLNGSTRLSPYIRFGILSIRHIYNLGKISEKFVKELAWREYWYALKNLYPYMNNLELREDRRNIKWDNLCLDAFYNGETGYPIIDAAIRQLKSEKWIHNRLRMLLASFFTKDLGGDWRLGEKFFSKHLIDYDEVVNVGNWQWIASVGTDYAIRIFNPVKQSKELDPKCEYIKTYIPELKDVPCIYLHDPITYRIPGYFPPIVNYKETRQKIKTLFGLSYKEKT
ncbi:MAG: deoxyribodipyrimidine photo-lyase [Candidatus Aenigmatarchaeota archaeon]